MDPPIRVIHRMDIAVDTMRKSFYASPEDMATIENYARAKHQPLSGFLRRCALEHISRNPLRRAPQRMREEALRAIVSEEVEKILRKRHPNLFRIAGNGTDAQKTAAERG